MQAHKNVLKEPGPRVFFREFGDSSLNFRNHLLGRSAGTRLSTLPDLLCAWCARFSEASIENPFPQNDIHIRSGELPAPADAPR